MKALLIGMAALLIASGAAMAGSEGKAGSPAPSNATVTGGVDNNAGTTVQARLRSDGAAATSDESFMVPGLTLIASNKSLTTGVADSMLLPASVLNIPKKWSLIKFRTAADGAGLEVAYRFALSAAADSSAIWSMPYGAGDYLGHVFVHKDDNGTGVTIGAPFHSTYMTALRDSTSAGFNAGQWFQAPYIWVWWKNVSAGTIVFDHYIWGTP